ncbi:Nonsense-mediated mRNA decay NMD3 family protein [Corchorus olitorius]|uniref:60S ribosomal export protein NMD3 n=1 Tax=Corchorus olitorius TaxID=93759 RepID=A0A1R3I4D8_9ROSI|nr:Nonsense-mediated mRNA decay NMD3 family protein [Corchorus olitorius]
MCVTCLRSEIDITQGLRKHEILMHCPDCQSYSQPPKTTWIKAQLESRELLKICLNRLNPDFKKFRVTLVNAEFIWTEPHSKRIKVKLKVQKEVINGAILEQSYVVEFVQQDHMCESCTRFQANPDQWVAAVQLRQRVLHRRTFFYLEQSILHHDAASHAIKIKQMDQGIDFFFANRSHAVRFVEFLGKVAPTRYRNDKHLVSHDPKSNNYNYKYTFSVEISPVCREDLICLPPRVAVSLGNFGPLVICTKVTNNIALLDPFTLRQSFLDSDQYWRHSFKSLLGSRQLVEYDVFNIELVSPEVNFGGSKFVLADAEVARVTDYGKLFHIRTHLGHILKPGDRALGYDLHGANSNDMELDKYKGLVLPEAILIKKSYEEKRQKKRGKPRPWKLKSLGMEVDESKGRGHEEKMNLEYEEFLRDLEEDPELRFNLSLYRNKDYQPSEMASLSDVDDDVPSVPLEELLAELDLSEQEDGGDNMSE